MKRTGTWIALGALVLALAFLGMACGKNKWAPDTRNANADSLGLASGQNVNDIQVLWKTPTAGVVTHKPLIRSGVIYFADWTGTVYAASVGTGTIVWQKTLQKVDTNRPWCGFTGTGVLSEDMLFEATAEGMLFALDSRLGATKWEKRFIEEPYAGNTGTLLYYDKMVYVPVSSMAEGMDQTPGFVTSFQGKVMAFDALTGKNVWEFKTVTGEGNGVGVWSGLALDPEAGILYFTTGNNYTGAPTEMSDAIIALDAKTGAKKWVKQCTSNDVWTMAQPKGPDYDFGAPPQLVDATVGGTPRKLVIAGQKSGVLWALDRMTGDVVWTDTLGAGAVGGGFMAAASVDRNGIYAWSNNAFKYAAPDSHTMDIAAFDPGTGRVLWKKTQAQPVGSTTAGFVAGGFYFVPSLDGLIRAYNTKTGDLAWTSSPMGSISTSLTITHDKIYFGTGLPIQFGGDGLTPAMHCIGIPSKK